ncbi:MAG TPA: multicopper oxidase domain-containing protein [Terriglobales bacterium]|nr:multicopper oxidase domain-containing protein [Terriglobales bacterium]
MFRFLAATVLAVGAMYSSEVTAQPLQTVSGSKVRTYYVAADEVDWDYAPGGVNKMMGMKFDGYSKVFVERGPHRIGSVYRKAIYREYTDESFAHLKPRPAEWESSGILGPILRAEVGDTIRVVFKNNATHPYSMHPHGVFYKKDSEGALYDDGTSGSDKFGSAVPPGKTHVYTWEVPERAGPGPNDPSSIVWLYHSHSYEMRDVHSGLVGAIIISRRGAADAAGKPKDVDREFVCLFMLFDENQSWYLDHNIQTYTGDPKGVNKSEFIPVDADGNLAAAGNGFSVANGKFAINGYIYGTGPLMTMKKGERVRWYLVGLGEGFSFHTPHWHGNVVLQDGKRTDVVSLMQAQMVTVDMVPDDPGTWMFHCHLDDHMEAGMMAFYKVEP